MDDKLYYVESPDGQILGPMNMIHIIEGIAEGVILESARICEVGAQEWVPLSSVTYTRAETPSAADVPAPAESGPSPESPFGLDEPEPAMDLPNEEELEILSSADHWAQTPREPEPTPAERPAAAWLNPHEEEPPAAELAPEELTPTEPEPAVPTLVEEPLAPAAAQGGAASSEPPSDFDLPDEDPFEVDESERSKEEWAPAAEEPAGGGGSKKWLIGAAVLAVPAAFAVYMLVAREWPAAPRTVQAPAPTAPVASTPLAHARNLLTSGRANEAKIGFQEILAEDPDNAAAHRGLGQAALASGDASLAVEHLEKAIALDDSRPVWLTDLSRALHDAGRTESAIQKLSGYLEGYPDDAEWQRKRLDWMLASGKQSEAASTYAALAAQHPQSALYQHLAGLALESDPKAETYLRRSIELDPMNGDVYVALARVLAAGGETDEAAATLRRAFERRPATSDEQALLASLQKAAPVKKQTARTPPAAKPAAKSSPPARTEVASASKPAAAKTSSPKPAPAKPAVADLRSRTTRVRRALADERFADARELLANARRELGNTAEVRRNVDLWEGIVAFEEERFNDALAKFRALDPDASYAAGGWGTGAVANWIARVHLAKGDPRNAVGALDGVGPTDPDEYAAARLWEGVALASLGMSDMAARTWERIPSDVGTRVDKPGRAAVLSAELLTGAISEKDYRNGVAAVSGYENDMHFFLAYAAQRRQDAAGAREHFEKSMELSAGREFPYWLARAEVSGKGILQR
jgi:tetratricopeptide (TPR) repeat protein